MIIVFVFLWVVEKWRNGAEWRGMARNGAEWRNGGMAEWLSYIPNVPDIFTVHADDCTYFDLLHCTYFEVLHLVQKLLGGPRRNPPF